MGLQRASDVRVLNGWPDKAKSRGRVAGGVTLTRFDDLDGIHLVDTHLQGTEGAFAAYVVEGEEVAVVDAGHRDGAEHILDALDELGIARGDVAFVALTHIHIDHAGGAPVLADALPNADVLCHEIGIPYLSEPDRLAHLMERYRAAMGGRADAYGEPDVVPKERFVPMAGGDTVDLGDRTLEVVRADGHCTHQVALHDTQEDALFVADEAGLTLMGGLHPTTPPPEFDLERNLASLERFADRDPEVLLYSHWGTREDPDEALSEYAEILPAWVEAVDEARQQHRSVDALEDALGEDWRSPTIRTDIAGVLKYLDDPLMADYPDLD